MAIALGYLYSYQASKMLTSANARATLASACLLGGMDDLCGKAYNICRESIRVDTIEEWLVWTDTQHQQQQQQQQQRSSTSTSSGLNGHSPSTSAPSTPRSPSSPSPLLASSAVDHRHNTPAPPPTPSIFGPYALLLRDDVLEFLIVSLPAILIADNNEHATTTTTTTAAGVNGSGGSGVVESGKSEISGEALEALLRVFSRVSFDSKWVHVDHCLSNATKRASADHCSFFSLLHFFLFLIVFKRAMESPKFFIGM